MKNILSKPLYLILAGLVIVAVIVGSVLVIKNSNDQASLKKADEIAKAYQPRIDDYKKKVDTFIKDRAVTVNSEPTAKAFASMIDIDIKHIPELETVGVYGAENSEAYKKAAKTRDQLKNSYEEFVVYLQGDLVSHYKYFDAVQDMLNMKVSDYLGNTQIMDGTPVREKLIPPYQAAYDKFTKLEVPDGQSELAKQTRNTFSTFITAAQDAAKKLDARESFSFDFSKEFADLQNQVNAQKVAVQATFAARVEQATK